MCQQNPKPQISCGEKSRGRVFTAVGHQKKP